MSNDDEPNEMKELFEEMAEALPQMIVPVIAMYEKMAEPEIAGRLAAAQAKLAHSMLVEFMSAGFSRDEAVTLIKTAISSQK